MAKKMLKTLMATVACATLVVGGASTTAFASGVNPNCPHTNYILEDSGGWYEDYDDNKHIYNSWREIYCMDCGDYVTETEDIPEGHAYNGDDICDDCGHVNE